MKRLGVSIRVGITVDYGAVVLTGTGNDEVSLATHKVGGFLGCPHDDGNESNVIIKSHGRNGCVSIIVLPFPDGRADNNRLVV